MHVVVASSIGIAIQQFRSCIDPHDNFSKTKTYFVLTEGLVRYLPGNKSILKGLQSKFKHLDA